MGHPGPQTLERLHTRLLACLIDLDSEPFDSPRWGAAFREARAIFEALPLTTAEIATSRNRLENFRSYLERGERGAAGFELRLLILQVLCTGG